MKEIKITSHTKEDKFSMQVTVAEDLAFQRISFDHT
jgi:hypothetical protein